MSVYETVAVACAATAEEDEPVRRRALQQMLALIDGGQAEEVLRAARAFETYIRSETLDAENKQT